MRRNPVFGAQWTLWLQITSSVSLFYFFNFYFFLKRVYYLSKKNTKNGIKVKVRNWIKYLSGKITKFLLGEKYSIH